MEAITVTKGLEYHLHKGKLWEIDLFSIAKRRFRGHLINMYKYLKGRYLYQDGARLFSVMPSDRQELMGTIWNSTFLINTRKNVFTLRVTENWHNLPSKVVDGVSILRDTWKPSGHGLEQLAAGDPAETEGLDHSGWCPEILFNSTHSLVIQINSHKIIFSFPLTNISGHKAFLSLSILW